MTIVVREAEALALLDSAIERLGQAVEAFTADDVALAARVLTASRRNRAAAHHLYASTLALLGDGLSPASEVRRTAALLHVIGRIRHMHAEVAAIAGLTGMAGEPPEHPHEATRALARMERSTLARLVRVRDAFLRQNGEPTGELMGPAPAPGMEGAAVLTGSAVVVARCLERVEDDAGEIAEQVVFVSSGMFQELAGTLWADDLPARSAIFAS